MHSIPPDWQAVGQAIVTMLIILPLCIGLAHLILKGNNNDR